MPCIGCPTSSPPRPAERASLSERRGLERVGDHLGEDPRKDRCPPPKRLPRVLPMPRVPGASSDPQVPGAVLPGTPWSSALLHPSPTPRPCPVLWSCDLGEKCPLQVCSVPKMPRKGRVFLKFLFILLSAVLGLRCCVGFLWSQRAGATLGCSPQASAAEPPLVAERGL